MGGRPNILSWLILGAWKPVRVRQMLSSLGGTVEGIMGSLPNLLTMGDMSLDGEDVVESHRQP